MNRRTYILVGTALIALAMGGIALAEQAKQTSPASQPTSAATQKAPVGSVQRQLDLKLRLVREGPLAQVIDHNRQAWESLDPEQREMYRQKALAFLQKSPAEQQELLKQYEKLIKMSADKQQAYRTRAQWLQVVLDSFTPQERQELQKATAKERAQRILQRKEELIKQGMLAPDSAAPAGGVTTTCPAKTSAPSSQPSTAPAPDQTTY